MHGWQRQRWITLAALALAWSGLGASCMLQRGEPQQWLEDYDALKLHMSQVYANLEWAVQSGRVDPYALDRSTQAALRETSSRRKARKTIEQFLEAFGDPHLRTERWEPGDDAKPSHAHPAAPIALDVDADEACKRMGFRGANHDFRLDLNALDGFEKLAPRSGNPFHAGVLQLDDGRRIGFVRIAQFGPDRYEDVARRLWDTHRNARSEPCDEACQWDFWHRVAQALLDALDARVGDLRAAGIEALAIDITRNGGGTDWAGIAPRLLTAQPLRCPPFGFVKHARESQRLERRLQSVQERLDDPVIDGKLRRLLESASERLQARIAEVQQPCDRLPLFHEPDVQLACSQLVQVAGCGLVDYVAPGELKDADLATLLYAPLRWRYREGVWDGTLFVVVDRHTASASEQFATLLQANGAARVVGERTTGAGCGYVDGGFPLELPHVGLRVHLPNCVRYRADGLNELEGVEPDVTVWTPDDKGKERARKLARALADLM